LFKVILFPKNRNGLGFTLENPVKRKRRHPIEVGTIPKCCLQNGNDCKSPSRDFCIVEKGVYSPFSTFFSHDWARKHGC